MLAMPVQASLNVSTAILTEASLSFLGLGIPEPHPSWGRMLQDLQQYVTQYGGTPETTGTVAGAVHRGWVNLKSALAMNDDKAVLNEVERGEDHAVTVYRNALAKDLPPEIKSVVQRMYEILQTSPAESRPANASGAMPATSRPRRRAANVSGESPEPIVSQPNSGS